jgi:hypothetical protein
MADNGRSRRGSPWSWLLDLILVVAGIAFLAYGANLSSKQSGDRVMGTFSQCTKPVQQHDPVTKQIETHQTCDVAWQHDGQSHTARIDIGGAGRGDGLVPLLVKGDRAAAVSRSTNGSSYLMIGLLLLGAVVLDLIRRGVRWWWARR